MRIRESAAQGGIVRTRKNVLIALALLALSAGCSRTPVSEQIDLDDPSLSAQEAASLVESRRRVLRGRDRELAPELILSAETIEARANAALAQGDEAMAKSLFAQAERQYLDAHVVADRVSKSRSLKFPKERAVGALAVAPWEGTEWVEIGDAIGTVEIGAEQMVQLSVTAEFTATDLATVLENGPGAIQRLKFN
jgi:hypothetical protein